MNRIVKNAFWIVGCKVIKMFLTLIVTILISRYLGPSNYGLINYAAGLVAFVTPLMKLGIDAIMTYEVIQYPDEEGKIIGTSMVMNVISSLLCVLGIIAFTYIANTGETETLVVCTIYSIILIFQALEIIQYWFQAKLLSKYTAIATVLAYFIVSVIQIILLATKMNIYFFTLSYLCEYFVIDIFLIIEYKKLGKHKIQYSFSIAKRLLAKGKYYIVSSMMVTIFAQTDKIMLKLMVNNEAVGYYSAGVTCAGMASFVFAAIIDSMRSTIFESKKVSQSQFEKNVVNLYSIIIYFSIIVSAFICILSPIIVKILYGSQYESTIGVLRIIVWYTTFSYLGTVRNIWILAENKQKYLWKINLSGATLNIIINAILIPSFGVTGAAIASLTTQIFTNVFVGYILKTIRRNNELMFKACKPSTIVNIIKKVNCFRKET